MSRGRRALDGLIYLLTGRAREEDLPCPLVNRGMGAILTSSWAPSEDWCHRLQAAFELDGFRVWHASPTAGTVKAYWRSHEMVGFRDAIPFLWGSGLMVRPEDVRDTMRFAKANKLQGGGNGRHGKGGGVFQVIRSISMGMPRYAMSCRPPT
eukprot:scaffold1220_cov259-Pinguiococcus_pyrenoidosus.AAC.98